MNSNSRTGSPDISRKHQAFANGLGWFSIGLGLTELLLPRTLARWIGVDASPILLRALGIRELASGIGILMQRRPTAAVWSRVAGDAMDLSLMGAAFAKDDTDEEKLSIATAAVLGATAADLYCALQLSRDEQQRGIHVHRTIAIDRSPQEVYAFWRNFENLPRFMQHLESVTVLSDTRSHWVARAPAGKTVSWDAEIINDHPNELIAWQSLPDAEIPNAGTVRFEEAPGGRGTFVRVKVEYHPPGGSLGSIVAKLFGEEPELQIQGDLYRFKQVMETGSVVTTEGKPAGRTRSTSRLYDDLVRH